MRVAQLTRQWMVLRELTMSRRGRTIIQLTRETGVHDRTLRRDIYKLQDAGFPIEKVEGEIPVRFRFDPGQKLPQLPFDFTEALALYHATISSPLFENPLYHIHLEQALYKIQDVFSEEVKGYLGRFRQAYTHRQPAPRSGDIFSACNILQKQITVGDQIRFRYTNLKGEETVRTVDPYFIHLHDGESYLLGYCHLRQDCRIFRVDCLQELKPLEESFQVASDFDSYQLLQTSFGVHLGAPGFAILRFEGVAARYFQRSPLHPNQKILELSEDQLLVEVPYRGLHEISEIVLRYGPDAEVVSPESLREHVAGKLQETLSKYQQIQSEN
ncbi:MAG: hypothetical protein B6I36_09760 [Desulfobacteraceae bacterium 4572_35.1]|nr:MAG: hypothetical protein B6I36_09760 [Desulfobacteraceae bacterium 4572_35.1]